MWTACVNILTLGGDTVLMCNCVRWYKDVAHEYVFFSGSAKNSAFSLCDLFVLFEQQWKKHGYVIQSPSIHIQSYFANCQCMNC